MTERLTRPRREVKAGDDHLLAKKITITDDALAKVRLGLGDVLRPLGGRGGAAGQQREQKADPADGHGCENDATGGMTFAPGKMLSSPCFTGF